jgi:hypothetical protein
MNTVDIIKALVTEDEYSAYGIHTVLNGILKEVGKDAIRPQMMYNYARNGMIVKGQKIFGETLRPFTTDEVVAFIVRYVERNKIDVAGMIKPTDVQLELDLNI